MGDILLANQAISATPASGNSVLQVDTTTKKFYQLDDGGTPQGILSRCNTTASQGALATTDTWITNSGILIPSFGMKAGQLFCWEITLSKTNAGTAQFILNVRTGSLQSTSDTSRLALTQDVAQAAVTSGGIMQVRVGVRNVGASGVVAGGYAFSHVTAFGGGKDGVSNAFDNTAMGGLYMGLSFTTGASAAWTITHVAGFLFG